MRGTPFAVVHILFKESSCTGFTIQSSTLKVKADLDARNLLIVSTDAIRLMVNEKEYQEFMLYYTFSKPRGCAYAKIDVSEVILEI